MGAVRTFNEQMACLKLDGVLERMLVCSTFADAYRQEAAIDAITDRLMIDG